MDPHTWYNMSTNTNSSEATMELDVQQITPEPSKLLTPIMIKMVQDIIRSMHIFVVRKLNKL